MNSLNVHHRPAEFPPELRGTAGSIAGLAATRVDRSGLFAALLAALELLIATDRAGALDLAGRWARCDELEGRDVEVRGADDVFTGRAEGIEDDGRLRVRLPGGTVRHVRSAETTVVVTERKGLVEGG